MASFISPSRVVLLLVFLFQVSVSQALFNGVHPGSTIPDGKGGTFKAPSATQSIKIVNADDFFCNAVCLSEKAVLTAAHCLSDYDTGGVAIVDTSFKSNDVETHDQFTSVFDKGKELAANLVKYDLAVVILDGGCKAGLKPLDTTLYTTQPVLLSAWGTNDANQTSLQLDKVRLWVGMNRISRRADDRRVYFVTSEKGVKTTDGTNALGLGGESGSALFEIGALKLAGILSGISEDKKAGFLVNSYVNLLSLESIQLQERAKRNHPDAIPDEWVQVLRDSLKSRSKPNPAPAVVAPPTSPAPSKPSPQTPPVARPQGVRREDPPSFLQVTEALRVMVYERFDAVIEEGLYFTPQKEVADRADLYGALIAEQYLEIPYEGGNLEFRVGYSPDKHRELWLIHDGLKYLLMKENGEANRFMPIPKDYFQSNSGVGYTDEKWVFQHRNFSENGAKNFNLRVFTVKPKSKNRLIPVLYYHSDTHKIIMANWPFIPADNTPEGAPDPAEVEINMIDLTTGTTFHLHSALNWPFVLEPNGILYMGGKDNRTLCFRPIDWYKNELGDEKAIMQLDNSFDVDFGDQGFYLVKKTKTGQSGPLTVGTDEGRLIHQEGRQSRFSNVTEKNDGAIGGISSFPAPENLLIRPFEAAVYSDPYVNEKLSEALGRSRNTWAILVYREGQAPRELLRSFFQSVDNRILKTPPNLEKLDRVWVIPHSAFNSKDNDEVRDNLVTVNESINGIRSVAVLEDFPTPLADFVDQGTMQLFWSFFNKCISEGTCRIVVTMEEGVFAKLYKDARTVVENATVIHIPEPDKVTRKRMADIVRRKLEVEYGKTLGSEAFDQIARYSPESGTKVLAPGLDEETLRDLFDYVDTVFPNVRDIDPFHVRKFMSRGVTESARLAGDFRADEMCKFVKARMVAHWEVIDKICGMMKVLEKGSHFGSTPISYFVVTGTPGVGKTRIGELIAQYLTGKGSEILIDFKNFKGWDSQDVKSTFEKIKAAPEQLRVVIFDDVDRANYDDLDRIRGIFDNGFYAKGTSDEVPFKNTVVIVTANWGEKYILEDSEFSADFFEKLSRDIVFDESRKNITDPNPRGKISNRVWRVLQGRIFVMKPFLSKHLFALARMESEERDKELFHVQNVRLKIHPLVLVRYVDKQKAARSGASYIINMLDTEVFPKYQDSLGDDQVKQVLLVPWKTENRAVTNKDEDYAFWLQNIDATYTEIDKHNADNTADPWAGADWYVTGDNAYRWNAKWVDIWQKKQGVKQ